MLSTIASQSSISTICWKTWFCNHSTLQSPEGEGEGEASAQCANGEQASQKEGAELQAASGAVEQ
jgi:hypothetical protein